MLVGLEVIATVMLLNKIGALQKPVHFYHSISLHSRELLLSDYPIVSVAYNWVDTKIYYGENSVVNGDSTFVNVLTDPHTSNPSSEVLIDMGNDLYPRIIVLDPYAR